MERYQERKCALFEALDLAQEHERVRRKNETRLFVLDFGSVQCEEFQKRSSSLVKALDLAEAKIRKEKQISEEKDGEIAELSSSHSIQKILAMLNHKEEQTEFIKDPEKLLILCIKVEFFF
jgi:hypothetical protein